MAPKTDTKPDTKEKSEKKAKEKKAAKPKEKPKEKKPKAAKKTTSDVKKNQIQKQKSNVSVVINQNKSKTSSSSSTKGGGGPGGSGGGSSSQTNKPTAPAAPGGSTVYVTPSGGGGNQPNQPVAQQPNHVVNHAPKSTVASIIEAVPHVINAGANLVQARTQARASRINTIASAAKTGANVYNAVAPALYSGFNTVSNAVDDMAVDATNAFTSAADTLGSYMSKKIAKPAKTGPVTEDDRANVENAALNFMNVDDTPTDILTGQPAVATPDLTYRVNELVEQPVEPEYNDDDNDDFYDTVDDTNDNFYDTVVDFDEGETLEDEAMEDIAPQEPLTFDTMRPYEQDMFTRLTDPAGITVDTLADILNTKVTPKRTVAPAISERVSFFDTGDTNNNTSMADGINQRIQPVSPDNSSVAPSEIHDQIQAAAAAAQSRQQKNRQNNITRFKDGDDYTRAEIANNASQFNDISLPLIREVLGIPRSQKANKTELRNMLLSRVGDSNVSGEKA